jgi:hypothetical protein
MINLGLRALEYFVPPEYLILVVNSTETFVSKNDSLSSGQRSIFLLKSKFDFCVHESL